MMAIPKKDIQARKFLVHVINRLTTAGILSLEYIKEPGLTDDFSGFALVPINGYKCPVVWHDIGFGEIVIRAWGGVNFEYIRQREEKYYKQACRSRSDTFKARKYTEEEKILDIIKYIGRRDPDTLSDFELLFSGCVCIPEGGEDPKFDALTKGGIPYRIGGGGGHGFGFEHIHEKSFTAHAAAIIAFRHDKFLEGDRNHLAAPYKAYFSRTNPSFIESLPTIDPLGYKLWGKYR